MNPKVIGAAALVGAATILVAQTGSPPKSSVPNAKEQTESLSRIKQLSVGMLIYQGDWDDIFPYAQSVRAVQYVTYPYVKNKDVYKSTNPSKPGPFHFNMNLGGVNAADITDFKTPMFYDPNPWPNGNRMYSCIDSSAKAVAAAGWTSVSKLLAAKHKRTAKKPLPANYGASFKL